MLVAAGELLREIECDLIKTKAAKILKRNMVFLYFHKLSFLLLVRHVSDMYLLALESLDNGNRTQHLEAIALNPEPPCHRAQCPFQSVLHPFTVSEKTKGIIITVQAQNELKEPQL